MKMMALALCLLSAPALAAPKAPAGPWEQSVNQAARLHRKGDLKGAEALLLKSLYTAEGFGEADPRLAYTLDYLGTLNMQMNEPDKAALVFERAVKAFKASRGAKSPETLESMGRLAESYESLSRYASAEPLYREILEAGRGDALQRSVDLNNLALVLDAQDEAKEALPLYQQALESREKAQGSMGEGLPEILNNLGRVYYLKGEYAAAEPLYRRAIAIDESRLKPGDPALSDDYRRLAACLEKAGRMDEAQALKAKAELKPKPATKKKKAP